MIITLASDSQLEAARKLLFTRQLVVLIAVWASILDQRKRIMEPPPSKNEHYSISVFGEDSMMWCFKYCHYLKRRFSEAL